MNYKTKKWKGSSLITLSSLSWFYLVSFLTLIFFVNSIPIHPPVQKCFPPLFFFHTFAEKIHFLTCFISIISWGPDPFKFLKRFRKIKNWRNKKTVKKLYKIIKNFIQTVDIEKRSCLCDLIKNEHIQMLSSSISQAFTFLILKIYLGGLFS